MVRTSYTFRLDPFAADYDAAIQLSADVGVTVERTDWEAVRPPAAAVPARVFCVDGVRRRWMLTAALGAAWFTTGEALLALIGGVAAVRAFGGTGAVVPDNGALGQFVFLVVALSALTVIPVSGVTVP